MNNLIPDVQKFKVQKPTMRTTTPSKRLTSNSRSKWEQEWAKHSTRLDRVHSWAPSMKVRRTNRLTTVYITRIRPCKGNRPASNRFQRLTIVHLELRIRLTIWIRQQPLRSKICGFTMSRPQFKNLNNLTMAIHWETTSFHRSEHRAPTRGRTTKRLWCRVQVIWGTNKNQCRNSLPSWDNFQTWVPQALAAQSRSRKGNLH